MNILVLTPLVPYPPHDGDKLRLYHFLKHLKARGHRIDLFCLTRVASDLGRLAELRPLCRSIQGHYLSDTDLFFNLLGGFLIGQSFNVASYFSPDLREALKRYWTTPEGLSVDVVLAHRLRMAPAAFEGNPGKPVVLELTDSLTAYTQQLREKPVARLSRRLAAAWDHWFLKREEVEWSRRAAATSLISEADTQALREQGADPEKLAVIPNGVDFKKAGRAKAGRVYPPGRRIVCFVGNMGYAPNEDGALWFLKEVWPLVKKRVPDALFAAVGGQPRKVLARFHDGVNVKVTGWVPEVEPYLLQAALSVAPLRVASGMQNKVALSLALGVPVVATPQAVAWLPPERRDGVIVGENATRFADEVVEGLLKPQSLRAGLKKGQRFVLSTYKWKTAGDRLEKILKVAAKSRGGDQ